MKVWMANKRNNNYPYHFVGGLILSVCLLLVFEVIWTQLSLYLNLSVPLTSGISAITAVVLLLYAANRIGQRAVKESLVWALDSEDKLWVMDIRVLAPVRGIISFFKGPFIVQKQLEQIRKENRLPREANEILCVDNIKEAKQKYYVVCRIRYTNGYIASRTFSLAKDIEDGDQLLLQLQKRLQEKPEGGASVHHYVRSIGISLGFSILFTIVSVLAYPPAGQAPSSFYFLCLFLSLVSYTTLCYFILKRKRGE